MTELAQIYPDVEITDPYSLEQFPTQPYAVESAALPADVRETSFLTYSGAELFIIALLFTILLIGVVHLYLAHGKPRRK